MSSEIWHRKSYGRTNPFNIKMAVVVLHFPLMANSADHNQKPCFGVSD